MELRAEVSYRYDPVYHRYEYVMLVISVPDDKFIMEIYVQHRLDGSELRTPDFMPSIDEIREKIGIKFFTKPTPGDGFGRWK